MRPGNIRIARQQGAIQDEHRAPLILSSAPVNGYQVLKWDPCPLTRLTRAHIVFRLEGSFYLYEDPIFLM